MYRSTVLCATQRWMYLVSPEASGLTSGCGCCLVQVVAEQEAHRAAVAAQNENFLGQIADVAAGTTDLAEGQVVTAASLAAAHGKVSMLAEAFKMQQGDIQVMHRLAHG